MTTFETASIGDEVWSVSLGWGSITNIHHDEGYPICVEFDSGKFESFTVEGRLYSDDLNPTLFWSEVKIVVPTKPLAKLAKDTCLEVWSNHNPNAIHKRHFSHFEDGSVYCFYNGGTSWTTGITVPWNHWREPK